MAVIPSHSHKLRSNPDVGLDGSLSQRSSSAGPSAPATAATATFQLEALLAAAPVGARRVLCGSQMRLTSAGAPPRALGEQGGDKWKGRGFEEPAWVEKVMAQRGGTN